MDRVIEFKKVIPITKAYEGDDGELYLEGESSGPELDLDKQFMTPTCIKGMADQVNATPVPYLDEHQKRGVNAELGTVVGAEVTPGYHMKTTTKLDKDNSNAVDLWKKVKKGKKFGQSIAGHVGKLATKVIDNVVYKGFDKIVLDHIANTTKPSWAPSLGTLVAKSLEDDGFDWADVAEYEGELPFSAEVVEKGSKPDPKAGKGYLLMEDLLNKLNSHFGWESYQDMIAESNRDTIPLKDLPLAATLPVGAVELSADDYDKDPEGYVEKAITAVAEPTQGPMDVREMAELYDRLYWLAESLKGRDERNGTKDGKKTVTRLKAAMAAVAEALKQTLSKSQPKPPVVPAQEVKPMPGENALKSFDQVGAVGQVPEQVPQQPQPSAPAGVLTDFSQVGQEPAPVAKAAPDELSKLLSEFGEAVGKAYVAEAPVDTKRQALGHIVKAFMEELDGRLETERPEEARLETMAKTIVSLQEDIEDLRRQLAVAKSQPVPEHEGETLVRKSLPGKMVLQPARAVQKNDQRPTFEDLVTGRGGLLP